MRKSRRPIVIVSRRSPLAQTQAKLVGQSLACVDPKVAVEYRWIESAGDKLAQTSLSDAGGKGLFAAAVEQALLNKEADLAVHSLKDLPAGKMPAGLVIAAVPPRADVRDCLISTSDAKNLTELGRGATLGTASPRRAAQAKRLRPDLQIQLIRGNIQTRLRKVLTDGRCDATLLAVAGLRRAGLIQQARFPIDPSVILTAAGQGALAIQCRLDDHLTLSRCLPLNDPLTAACVHAERQIVAAMGGDCHSPIAALVQPMGQGAHAGFRVRVRVLSWDGQQCLEADQAGPASGLGRLTKQVATKLRQAGCDRLLKDGR